MSRDALCIGDIEWKVLGMNHERKGFGLSLGVSPQCLKTCLLVGQSAQSVDILVLTPMYVLTLIYGTSSQHPVSL